jgi:hypothetical protein
MDIANGKVDGDNISFDQVLNFNGNSFTISYQGKAAADGTINFTRTFGGGGDRPPQTFVAKRATDAAPAAPAAPVQPAPPAPPPPPPTGTTATPQ